MPYNLDGRTLADKIRVELQAEVFNFVQRTGITPALRVLWVGEDGPSQIYVHHKAKTAQNIGIDSRVLQLSGTTPDADIIHTIEEWNADPTVHAVLLQLPLPPHLSHQKILNKIHPHKDVDGLHPYNLGALLSGRPTVVPCTPKGILRLLKEANVALKGSSVVVVGRGLLVGRPVTQLLLQEGATVVMCHRDTKDLKYWTKQADILISATGVPNLITSDMLRPRTVVVDVGSTPQNGKVCGDVDTRNLLQQHISITPVPGGVGPMTIAMLMENTLSLAQQQCEPGHPSHV
jgi:methylenetetrahydrofolate dehydrogenase (NADP+)/methenyltetrahydrofolate cyclohydrolase